ncbi:MAG: hypothetical protein JNK15_20855, partial [Planctomycetes bacterium]|nr:hypothetical protein [Planctomycetota bacterium]
MGFINVAERTINAKLVYYGVGVGGKTTSLQQVHGILCPRNEVQLVSINTEEDSTLLFDFLPINLGQVGGFKIRIQGFTVPGQPKYRRMRKLVLQGADAVVLVVDSQRSRAQENAEALQSMRENLRTSTGTSEDIPIVVQYNKRDLPDILEESELDRTFRFRPDIATFPSVATDGQGVFEAFVEAVSRLVERKVVLYGLGRGQGAPHEVADGVRQKLWAICDEVRRSRSAVPVADLPQARVALVDGPAEATGPAADAAAAGDKDLPLSAFSLAGAEVAADKAPAEDEFELSYTLRDSAGATAPVGGGKVLSDEELQFDLQPGLVVEAPTDVVAPEEEAESGL